MFLRAPEAEAFGVPGPVAFVGRPGSGTRPKDKNYNLIAVLYQSSDNVEPLKTYIQDADQELVEFFGGILENNLKAAQRAKEMHVPRFRGEQK